MVVGGGAWPLRNAQRQDEYEHAIMNDEAALEINMGFYGRSEDDD